MDEVGTAVSIMPAERPSWCAAAADGATLITGRPAWSSTAR
jgi:hypothetical protein